MQTIQSTTPQTDESALVFECDGDVLVGILHHPAILSDAIGDTAVLVVVGGPQYRAGSHRQFLLLARDLAAAGLPVLRFDYRSMGDSSGQPRDFEAVQVDIRAAIDKLQQAVPQVTRIVIWGLCDAASAACFYACSDPRVQGLVLLNPWVRTESGIAKAYLKHYYLKRLLSADMWKKLLSGNFDFKGSMKSLAGFLKSAQGRGLDGDAKRDIDDEKANNANKDSAAIQSTRSETSATKNEYPLQPLPDRMYQGLKSYTGPVLFILSGDDLTADEFRDRVKQSRPWQRLLAKPQVTKYELTFLATARLLRKRRT